jgi:hypothetical protein
MTGWGTRMNDSNQRDEAWLGALSSLPEVLGPQHLPKLNEGLRYLFKELRQAEAAFSRDSHLDGAYFSVLAVYGFLSLFRAISIEGLAMPLMALESALWALDEGITEPLLKPVRRAKGGRPRASHLRQEFIGVVAFTVDRLCKFGYPLSRAHAAVAADLNQIGAKMDRGDRITSRTIRFWCEQVSEDVGKRLPPGQRYTALMEDPRTVALDRMPAEAAANHLRSRLMDTARRFGLASPPRKPVNPSC